MSGPAATGRRKLFVDIGSSLLTRLLLLPLGVASSVIVTRALEPEGKGIYTTALTIVTLGVALCALGYGRAATYFLARQALPAAAVRTSALRLSAVNGALLSVALAGAAVFAIPALLPDLPSSALLIAAPIAFVTLLRLCIEGFLRGEQRNTAVNALAIVASASFLLAVVATELLGGLSANASVAFKGASVVLAVAWGAKLLGRRRLGLGGAERSAARALGAFAIPYALVTMSQSLSYRLDIVLIQGFLGNADVGYYSVTTTLAELLWYVPMAVGFVVFPRTAAQSGDSRGASEVAALARWTFVFTCAAAGTLAVASGLVVEVLFGPAFEAAVEPTRLILVGIVATTWFQILGGYLQGQGRLRAVSWAAVLGLVLNLGLNLVLIPEWGLAGAAVSSSISYTVSGVIVLSAFLRESRLPLRRVIAPTLTEVRQRAGALRERAVSNHRS